MTFKFQVWPLMPMPSGADNRPMECAADVQCPYCGQVCGVVIDTMQGDQRWTTDCEVCCRPFEVVAECEPGEVIALEVLGG